MSACDDFPANAANCAATVGDANACTEAQADALEKRANDADAICKNEGGKRDKTLQTSQACARVEQMCPKLFDEPALDHPQP